MEWILHTRETRISSLEFSQYGGYLVMLVCMKHLFQLKVCIYRLRYNPFNPPPPPGYRINLCVQMDPVIYNINAEQIRKFQS